MLFLSLVVIVAVVFMIHLANVLAYIFSPRRVIDERLNAYARRTR